MADKFAEWLKDEIQNTSHKLERLEKFGDDLIRTAETNSKLDALKEAMNVYTSRSAVHPSEIDSLRKINIAATEPFKLIFAAGKLLLERQAMVRDFLSKGSSLHQPDREKLLDFLNYINENIKLTLGL